MSIAVSYSHPGNLLVNALPEQERNLLLDSTKRVFLAAEEPVYEFDDSIKSIYFPLDAVFSTCSLMEDGSSAEISLTGREGLVGVSAAFDRQASHHWTSVLVAGHALKMETSVLSELTTTDEVLRIAFLQFYRQLMGQVSQRAVCNGRHTLLQRFCFWLLLVHDRTLSSELPLTHETIARKLGARRAGITNVAGTLQEMGAISYSRGVIQVSNRTILETEVCECYRAVLSAEEKI